MYRIKYNIYRILALARIYLLFINKFDLKWYSNDYKTQHYYNSKMKERIYVYPELKYTAINCGIETTDIAIIIEYILANLEEKRSLRPTLIKSQIE